MRRDYAEFGVEMNKVEALPRMDTASECAESALDASVVKQPKRVMGAFSATMIVVASMVGTGVFTTTGILLETTPSAPAVLWGWLIGGIIAFPVVYYIMHQWQMQYVKQAPIPLWLYPAILVAMALLILVTIFWQIRKVAKVEAEVVLKE